MFMNKMFFVDVVISYIVLYAIWQVKKKKIVLNSKNINDRINDSIIESNQTVFNEYNKFIKP